MIPYVVFCTDLVVALGSGCTIKFFPLWFKNDLRHAAGGGARHLLRRAAVDGVGVRLLHGFVSTDRACGSGPRRPDGGVNLFRGHARRLLSCSWSVAPSRRRGAVHLADRADELHLPVEESILMDYAPRILRAGSRSSPSRSSAGAAPH